MSSEAAKALIEDPPRLHAFPRGGMQTGGVTRPMGEYMIDRLVALDSPVVIETGAGLSTLLFCCLALRVTSIAPDAELWQRIEDEAGRRSIDLAPLRQICDRSDLALPRLAEAERASVDLAFIDGDHGWPSVFVDFCYMNMMLREGGLLLIDDIFQYSVAQLAMWLRQQPEFEYEGRWTKMVTFRKTSDSPFVGLRQPFILANSLPPAR